MINIVETKISYRNGIPYVRTDDNETLFIYILFQCNMDIMSLIHYLMYVAEVVNYQYVLFHTNVQCIFFAIRMTIQKYIII
jgi:hypothetical protein